VAFAKIVVLLINIPSATKIPPEQVNLIRQMAADNPPWGAPCIHSELLKLGIEISGTTEWDSLRSLLFAISAAPSRWLDIAVCCQYVLSPSRQKPDGQWIAGRA
jgi:hypothetical protein